jgi:hypothetical protein
MGTSKKVQIISVAAAVTFVVIAMIAGYLKIGLPPVVN